MKKILAWLFMLSILGTSFGLAETAYAAETASFTLSASSTQVNVGDSFVLSVDAENMQDFFSYELFLEFDSAKLELVGSPKSVVPGFPATKVKEGSVQFGSVKTEKKLQSGKSVALCTFTFKVKAAGSSDIKLAWLKSYDLDVKTTEYAVNNKITVEGLNKGNVILLDKLVLNAAGTAQGAVAEADLAGGFGVASNVIVNVSAVSGAKAYGISLPFKALSEQQAAGRTIAIHTEYGTVILPVHMLSGYAGPAADQVELNISRIDAASLSAGARTLVGNRPAIGLSLVINGAAYSWDNPDAAVSISIPYAPSAQELGNQDHIVLLYLDGDGEPEAVPTGKYDASAGAVTFKTTHFSRFAVSYVVKTFDDIAVYTWATREIQALASKGIIKGVTATEFAPQASITRADFVLLLTRALGLNAKTGDNFSDVSPDAYYASAVAVAKKLGIITGIGGNQFKPADRITRQDMITIMHRACAITGIHLEAADPSALGGFPDASSIAPYAVDSFAAMVTNKIVSGSTVGLEPLKYTTRAETAVLLYRLYTFG
ncbi:MAG: hypothetical protein GXX99_04415 [Clostridiales bacterium]|nr:hypothetical protein [Clostridiales bacterium]